MKTNIFHYNFYLCNVFLSLLNKVHQVPKCTSAQVPGCLKCLKCPNAKVPLEGPWSAQVPFECPARKKPFKISGNAILHGFAKFFKDFSKYSFCITLIADCFLRKKICKFYHVLQARYTHSKGFQKVSKVSEN